MTKLSKILNYILIALFVVSAVFSLMFYVGGEIEGATYHTPVYTDPFINWGIILFFITIVVTIVFEGVSLILRPQNAVRTLISIGILAVVVLISYSLSDVTPLVLPGYEGSDNVPSMLMMTDMLLYSTYFLVVALLGVIVFAEVSKALR